MPAVAPFAGVWIEIAFIELGRSFHIVAPFAGVWIEIRGSGDATDTRVAPFAGVWIEIFHANSKVILVTVAPFAGVWIEIKMRICFMGCRSRTLRGCVD